jgi:dolichol-phosphate mannosyltransferase
MRKLVRLAVNTALSFSNKPLRYAAFVGLLLAIVSMCVAVGYFVGAMLGVFAVEGWATLVISIWFLGGINLLGIGVVGLYVSQVFEQTKQRPTYIVRRTTIQNNVTDFEV